MADLAHVKGLDQLQRFLDQLPAKIERNIARGALRAGANVVKPHVVANINRVDGVLADSIKVGSRARGGVVTASVYTRVFYARFVEYGTKPHRILAGKGKGLSIGGLFFAGVEHPGAAPHPFMRPALDARWHDAVLAAAEYMKRRLATKYGLDTADIAIGEEE